MMGRTRRPFRVMFYDPKARTDKTASFCGSLQEAQFLCWSLNRMLTAREGSPQVTPFEFYYVASTLVRGLVGVDEKGAEYVLGSMGDE
jgi:hypothetical protein